MPVTQLNLLIIVDAQLHFRHYAPKTPKTVMQSVMQCGIICGK